MSIVKLYKTNLSPQKNSVIEDIDNYLETQVLTYSSDDFQQIKFDLDIVIKINYSQAGVSKPSLGNYCSITQDNKTWYYFIMGVKWTAKETVAVQLSIDSANTFINDLNWSNKTTIIREHRDRFYPKQKPNVTTYLRRIEKESEGLSFSGELTSSTNIVKSDALNMDFYLMYKTRDDLSESNLKNPISCYLFGSKPMIVKKGSGSSVSIQAADLPSGTYCFFTELDNPTGKFTIYGTPNATNPTDTYTSSGLRMLCCRVVDGQLKYQFVNSYAPGDNLEIDYTGKVGDISVYKRAVLGVSPYSKEPVQSANQDVLKNMSGPWINCSHIVFEDGNFFRVSTTDYSNIGGYGVVAKVPNKLNIGAGNDRNLLTIDSIDRTDSRIMKIIKLPYAPTNISYVNGVYEFGEEWEYEAGLMRLKEGKLFTQFQTTVANIQIPELFVNIPTIDTAALRNDDYESKLYHSDFYTFKLAYDSFVKNIDLERINLSAHSTQEAFSASTTPLPIIFKPTNTMNSKFAFKVNYDTTYWANFATYDKVEDYEDYLLVSRNNEETLFNNDYVNYIRNGYNYDQKMRSEQIKANWTNTIIQSTTSAAQFLTGFKAIPSGYSDVKSGTDLIGLSSSGIQNWQKYIGDVKTRYTIQPGEFSRTAGISAGSNAISSIINNLQYQKTSEMQLEQKKAQLAAQSTSVAGADDMDLLSYYNGNRLQLKKYKPNAQILKSLGDLFYYTGYKYTAQEIPQFNSRYWFNFVQCEPVFKDELTSPYADYLSDVKARFAAGVTIYHNHNNTWDLDQEKENWETILVEA